MTKEPVAIPMLSTPEGYLIWPHTPEGLAVTVSPEPDGSTVVREVGHFGYVVYEYRMRPNNPGSEETSYSICAPRAEFLIDRVVDLEARCSELSKSDPHHIDLQRWKRNRKAARRRLRRWIHEQGASVLQMPEQHHALVRRIIEESPATTIEFDADALNKKLWEEGAIDDFYEYERRKAERVVIIVPGLPAELHSLLSQAEEAYFHGLFRAAVALSRAVLEDLLRRVARFRSMGVGPVPINDERLDVLIKCMPESLLNAGARAIAHEVRTAGNDALHGADASFSEDEAWRVLALTRKVVELVINRGGLNEPE